MSIQEPYWGYHLMIEASDCNSHQIRCKANVEGFARTLVKTIDMVAFEQPRVVHFGSGNKEGFTLTQLIETSLISGHFVNETNDIYLDVFSCKNFEPFLVEDVLSEFFQPKYIQSKFLLRQAKREY